MLPLLLGYICYFIDLTGVRFSLTPPHCGTPRGVNHNAFIIMISPGGANHNDRLL